MGEKKSKTVTFWPLWATLCLAVAVAWAGSFLSESAALGVKIKSYSLFSDVFHTPTKKSNNRKKLKQVNSTLEVKVSDSILNEEESDTLALLGLPNIVLHEYPKGPVPIEDFGDSLPNFRFLANALDSVKQRVGSKKLRIGYWGDSAIEGDLVTQDLRRYFQRTYGGGGIGWVPITSPVAGYRITISHKFSENWSSYTWMSPKKPAFSMGWGGTLGIPSSEKPSWVRYQQKGTPVNVSLFLRNRQTAHTLTVSNREIEVDSTANLQRFGLGNGRVINLQWPINTKDEVYGLSFESEEGVILDNLSLRGNSGLPLAQLNVGLTKQFARYLPYQCLVLQYGLNVANPELTSLHWYEVGLRRAIRHLKKLFPSTTILIIGVGDKSAKIDGEYRTDPSIPHIVGIQRKIAMEEKVCFWSLFHAMGGENAALDWIAQTPPLLAKDYTHLSPAGAKKVASMLETALQTALKPAVQIP